MNTFENDKIFRMIESRISFSSNNSGRINQPIIYEIDFHYRISILRKFFCITVNDWIMNKTQFYE